MNIQVILTVTVLLTLTLTAGAPTIVSAQYFGNMSAGGETGVRTLEEALKIQEGRVPVSQYGNLYSEPPPHSMLALMVTALLGGIATIFFIKGRSGKYAAVGRG